MVRFLEDNNNVGLLLFFFCGCREPRQVLCLIFVERIVTAKVIERFVKKVSFLSDFMVSYLTGSQTSVDSLAPKVQKETLELFRSGKVSYLLYNSLYALIFRIL